VYLQTHNIDWDIQGFEVFGVSYRRRKVETSSLRNGWTFLVHVYETSGSTNMFRLEFWDYARGETLMPSAWVGFG
jgi:hypothetical protein